MKNIGTGYAIGYIIGGIILLPLVIFLVNKFFFQGNDVEGHIQEFLKKEQKISLNFDKYPKITRDYERYTAFLSKKRNGIIHISAHMFYSEQYKKYFQLRMANIGDNFYWAYPDYLDNGLGIIVTVNSDDMKNPKYGTKENPVPVFRVVGDKKPILYGRAVGNGETVFDNYDITQSQYENSVYCHLKYVMSKEEFKERFEKK